MIKQFRSHWGKLRRVPVPYSIIQSRSALDPACIAVLAVLYYVHKTTKRFQPNNEPRALAKVSQELLIKRTGYSRRAITDAISTLHHAGYIQPILDRKGSRKNGSGAAQYILQAQTGDPFTVDGIGKGKGWSNLLAANGERFFTVPLDIITNPDQQWSLAKMTGSETALYFACCYQASLRRSSEFTMPRVKLRELTGLSLPTYKRAIDGLEERGLLWFSGVKDIRVQLCDPFEGAPLHAPEADEEDDAANYYTVGKRGVSKRFVLNAVSPQLVEELIRSAIPDGEPIQAQSNGNLTIRCPFHPDSTPSLSVSPAKRCFYCFGCHETGTVTRLVAKLEGITHADAIKRTAAFMGQTVEFHQPDSKATIYSYTDAKGRVLKQVLRYPNDAEGNKVIHQRRPVTGGWALDVSGLPPMLYNRALLDGEFNVYVVEGEKDAQTLTELWKAGTLSGIATTSGGATTWDASLAKELRGRRVTVMPDADDAGAKYAEAVVSSLKAEGIEHRVVSFEGAGAKDVTEFLERNSADELVRRIAAAWEDATPVPNVVEEMEETVSL